MNKIKCPKCGEVFQIDESSYAQILSQVRNREFQREVSERIRMQEEKQELVVEKALREQEKELRGEFGRERQKLEAELEYYRDLKARQSTKMVGETLEQHCMTEFESIRAAAFPNAYFAKDNDVSDHSKGDFIFRDFADGLEFVSIMFEMKTEMDTTSAKHKNEEFFKKLDKDRREKNCEYAVLVSLLESDSELYNRGIVDVSHKYEKMYVVRPQFFIPIISLLRNAARNSLEDKRQLKLAREQQIDITHFEENLNAFKDSVGKSYTNASKKFQEAIAEIDATIKHLEKVKEALQTSEKHLATVNSKSENITIRKLTKNAPSVMQSFRELRETTGEASAQEVIEPDAVF